VITMPDRRRIKLVITAISDGGNFETAESDSDAATKVVDVVVDNDKTLHDIVQWCHRVIGMVSDDD